MKRSIYLIITLALLQLLSLSPHLYSQHKLDIGAMTGTAPATPAAATFENFGSFENIDYLTGTLNATLPIHELKIGSFTLPLTISYSNQGCRPNRRPGVCGLGWELSYGCSISRQLNGLPDEHARGMLNDTMPAGNECSEISYIKELSEGKRDGMWDVYHYNIPGHSGKFVKNITYPYDPLIQVSSNAQTGNFTIKDGSGVIYDFIPGLVKYFNKVKLYEPAQIDDTVALYVNRGDTDPGKSYQYNAQWLPNEISVYNSHDRIYFSYTDDVYKEANMSSIETVSLFKNISYYQGVFTEGDYYGVGNPSISKSSEGESTKKLLNALRTNDEVIFFYYAAAPGGDQNLLQSIEVYKSYQKIKTIYFLYSNSYPYYLKKVEYAGADGRRGQAGNQVYRFTYNGEGQAYPATDSRAKDLWGYYNGATNNQSLLSIQDNLLLQMHCHKDIAFDNSFRYKESDYACKAYYTGEQTQPGNYYSFKDLRLRSVPEGNRRYSFTHALLGSLATVTYPTGGQLSYRYEANAFRYPIAGQLTSMTNAQGAGIRIAEITKAENGEVQRRLIRYGNENGQENGIAQNVALPCNLLPVYYQYGQDGYKKIVQNLVVYSEAVNPLDICHGSAVVYQYATDYLYDETGKCMGKTLYTYNPPYSSSWQMLTMFNSDISTLGLFSVFDGNRDLNQNGNDRPVNTKYYRGTDPAAMQLVKEDKNYFREYYSPVTTWLNNVSAGLALVRVGNFEGPELSWGKASYLSPRTGELVSFDATFVVKQGQTETYASQCGFLPEDQPGHQVDPNKKIFAGQYSVSKTALAGQSFTYVLDSTVTIEYDITNAAAKKLSVKTAYQYDDNLLPTTVETYLNNNDRKVHDYSYGVYASPWDPLLNTKAQQWHIKTLPNYERIWEGTTEYYLANLYRYDNTDGLIYRDKITKSEPPVMDYPLVSFDKYDGWKGNLLQYSSQDGLTNAILWNEYGQTAVVKNATLNAIAYDGFEFTNYGFGDISWTTYASTVQDPTAPTGATVAEAYGGTIAAKNNLPTGKYIVSYWAKGGAIYVNGSGGAQTIKTNPNGWTLYRQPVQVTNGNVTITGSGRIDELRLHPEKAQMATYAYNRQGQPVSMTDDNMLTVYYQYDYLGRLIAVKDENGKTIRKIKYNYLGQAEENMN